MAPKITKIQGKGHKPYLGPRDAAALNDAPTLQTYPARSPLNVGRPGLTQPGKKQRV